MLTNNLVPINTKGQTFQMLMQIYEKAQNQVLEELIQIKEGTSKFYGYDVIHYITSRIKTPKSIIGKMKKKNYELNYQNLIDHINDIAGIRIVCPLEQDISTIVTIIENMPNIKIIKVKDYLTKPKQSGYSGYHIVVQTPVKVKEKEIPVKVEIQLRTIAMDFWATNEHKMKYKTTKKISLIDSKKLSIYAKVLQLLESKIAKIYQKQNNMA